MAAFRVVCLVLAITAAEFFQTNAAEVQPCAGCPALQNPTELSTERRLTAALATVNSNEGVHKILSVSRQVVAGLKFTVVYESTTGKTCTATWVDAPWMSSKPLGTKVSCTSRARRSTSDNEINLEDLGRLETFRLNQLGAAAVNEQTNKIKTVVKMLKANLQVVNLVSTYKMTLMVKTTNCSVDEISEDSCMNKEIGPREICSTNFTTSPFLTHTIPFFKVQELKCRPITIDDFDKSEVNTDMKESQPFVPLIVNQQINSMTYKGLYKIVSVESKPSGEGLLHTFTTVLRDTNCTKPEGLKSPEKCHFVEIPRAKDIGCTTSVLSNHATGTKKVLSNQCQNLTTKSATSSQ